MVVALGLSLILQVKTFVDKSSDLGLALGNDNACWVDINNDSWPDLCAGGAVWINEKGQKFRKHLAFGPCVSADFDNDGFNDLFSFGSRKLLKNHNGISFSELHLPSMPETVSRGACCGDFDGNGYVDIFVGGFEDWDRNITYPSFILMNRDGRAFDLTWKSSEFRTRGVTACDFDLDHDLDIYASNYRLQPNNLLINDGNGVFADKSSEFNAVATSAGFPGGHSIGSAWADFNNDGNFDMFAGNFAHVDDRGDQPKSRFLKNLGARQDYKFADQGPCGIQYQESYASPAVGDFDNDGVNDLYFTTVYPVASFNKPNHPVLFRIISECQVEDVTAKSGLANLGATYQAAWADFDNDGDLDLVTDGKLFQNQGSKGNWIELQLRGDGKQANSSAIGAQVRIRTKTGILTRQVESGTGEGNQNDLTLHFGVGDLKGTVTAEITWPNGKIQTARGVRVNSKQAVRYKL